jgi:hypothetical protein
MAKQMPFDRPMFIVNMLNSVFIFILHVIKYNKANKAPSHLEVTHTWGQITAMRWQKI